MNFINRICILILSVFGVNTTKAQDFTTDELVKLRASNLSDFESAVMARGYELTDVISDYDHYEIFKKDNPRAIFGYIKKDHSDAVNTEVIYRTLKIDEFRVLLAERKEDPSLPTDPFHMG